MDVLSQTQSCERMIAFSSKHIEKTALVWLLLARFWLNLCCSLLNTCKSNHSSHFLLERISNKTTNQTRSTMLVSTSKASILAVLATATAGEAIQVSIVLFSDGACLACWRGSCQLVYTIEWCDTDAMISTDIDTSMRDSNTNMDTTTSTWIMADYISSAILIQHCHSFSTINLTSQDKHLAYQDSRTINQR